jgi:hypothetical protein
MLPVVFLAVLLALQAARRWLAPGRRQLAGLAVATLLIALFSGGVGIAEVGASSYIDYQYQAKHLELLHSFGNGKTLSSIELAGFGPAAPASYALYCNLRGIAAGSAVSLMEYATLMVHVRALFISTLVLLTANLVIASVLVLLLRDRLWSIQLLASPPASETASQLLTAT